MNDLKQPCAHCHNPEDESEQRTKSRSVKQKDGLINRLNRVEGQIRGIKGMIEKDVYCDDVLNQIAAVQAAMKSISKLVLEGHMKSCLIERVQSGDVEVVDELLDTIRRML